MYKIYVLFIFIIIAFTIISNHFLLFALGESRYNYHNSDSQINENKKTNTIVSISPIEEKERVNGPDIFNFEMHQSNQETQYIEPEKLFIEGENKKNFFDTFNTENNSNKSQNNNNDNNHQQNLKIKDNSQTMLDKPTFGEKFTLGLKKLNDIIGNTSNDFMYLGGNIPMTITYNNNKDRQTILVTPELISEFLKNILDSNKGSANSKNTERELMDALQTISRNSDPLSKTHESKVKLHMILLQINENTLEWSQFLDYMKLKNIDNNNITPSENVFKIIIKDPFTKKDSTFFIYDVKFLRHIPKNIVISIG